MALQVVLKNIYSEASAETCKLAILEPKSRRQLRMESEMVEVDAETLFNCFKILADREFATQRIGTLCQIAQS